MRGLGLLSFVLNIPMSMQTRESANPVAVQLQFSCSLFNRFAHSSGPGVVGKRVEWTTRLYPLSVPFSLVSLCCPLSFLAAAYFADPTAHLSHRISHQAIHSASNPLGPVPRHSGTELLPSAALSS